MKLTFVTPKYRNILAPMSINAEIVLPIQIKGAKTNNIYIQLI